PFQAEGERGQRVIEIFVLNNHEIGDAQVNRGEVPDGADSRFHHQVGSRLGGFRWGRDHAQMDVHTPPEFYQAVQVKYFFSSNGPTHLEGIGIERGYQVETQLAELLVTEQGAAQTTGSCQKCLVGTVPTQEILNPADQYNQWIADF